MTLRCGNMAEEKGGHGCGGRMIPKTRFSFRAVALLWYDPEKVTSPTLGLDFCSGLYHCPCDRTPEVPCMYSLPRPHARISPP